MAAGSCYERLLLFLQKRRARNSLAVFLLLTLVLTHFLIFSPKYFPRTKERAGSYYPEVEASPGISAQLAEDLQKMKNQPTSNLQKTKGHWARPPTLTVPTRRLNMKHLKKAESVKGVVRQSLSKHAENRAEAVTEMEDGFDGLVVGEEVRKVKDLGIDRKRKAKQGGNQGGLGEMLKAGLNTLNTIQTMSKVFGGGSDGAGGGKNVVVDLVGSLLTNQGAKGKKQMRGKSALDPLVDSAFDLLGGEDATGGLRRYAKPFLKTMFS